MFEISLIESKVFKEIVYFLIWECGEIRSKGFKTGTLIEVMYIDYSEFRAKVLKLRL